MDLAEVNNSDSDDNGDFDYGFSDDEMWDKMDFGAFDRIEFGDRECDIIINTIDKENMASDSDSDDGDFNDNDRIPLFYHSPEFTWAQGGYSVRCRSTFNKTPGPVKIFDVDRKAIDFFHLFYSDEIFDKIVEFTNLNANRKREREPDQNKGVWYDVTREEIMAYYGVLLLMEMQIFPRDEMYWSSGASYPYVKSEIRKIFPRDRFMQIRRYLHFSDDTTANHTDRLFKFRYMIDELRKSFMSNYVPHEHISVDEAMIPFKGRLSFKQYMKDKPLKFGIKMWVLADAVTAYCHNFDIYVGKYTEGVNKLFGLTGHVVISLTEHLQNEFRTVYTDNYYTSPILAHYLESKGIYTCGTVRCNRIGFPTDIVKTKSEEKNLPRGHLEWRQCGPIFAHCWKDNRMVYYLSTGLLPEIPGLLISRTKKDGSKIEFPCHPAATEYQIYMGGVDRLDQMTRLNKSKKTMRWYRRGERKLFEISVFNAYVIEGHTVDHNVPGKRKRDLLSFKLDLAHQLISSFQARQRAVPGRPRSDASNALLRLDGMSHLPVAGEGTNHLCYVCNLQHKNFKKTNPQTHYSDNPYKQRKSSMKCIKCDVYLCCNPQKSCFKDFHTKVNL